MLGNLLAKRRRRNPDYDEDFFKDTRMSFGDHLEELRWRMWRAIKGLGLCLVIGFILDSIGDAIDRPWLGIGKPMLKIITDPVESQVRAFYKERNDRIREKLQKAREGGSSDDPLLRTTAIPVKLRSPEFEKMFGQPEI